MARASYIIFHIFFMLAFLHPLSTKAQEGYPTPPDKFERLFYIQRTGNTNTICYDAQFSANKSLNTTQPTHVYWIRYGDKGEIKPLSYIQKTFAYGLKWRQLNENDYEINLVSYAKKKIRLNLSETGKPYAAIDLNGKRVVLHHIFVKTVKGTSMLSLTPTVEYVEIFGKNPQTGASVYEKIIP
jgi:Domain of unknown function (DUF4833)